MSRTSELFGLFRSRSPLRSRVVPRFGSAQPAASWPVAAEDSLLAGRRPSPRLSRHNSVELLCQWSSAGGGKRLACRWQWSADLRAIEDNEFTRFDQVFEVPRRDRIGRV